ncbi:ion channel [Parasalinivibrio latis]
MARANLIDVNLVKHNSKSGYDLSHSDFYRANLQNAHLFKASFEHGSLMKADLSHANIHCVNLCNCNLLGTRLANTKIDNVRIGSQVRQETEGLIAARHREHEKMVDLFEQSEEIYRDLRKAAEKQGIFTMAGHFLQKELTMRRYQMPKFSLERLISKTVDLFCGYGEDPIRVVLFSLLLIFISAVLYAIFGIQHGGAIVAVSTTQPVATNLEAFASCLYYSVVTFTTLGYGDFVPIGFSRLIAATEAFTGSFTIALFVVVFVKKMTR